MNKAIEFPTREQGALMVARSDEFIVIAHKVGDMLNGLPLTPDQHNDLVAAVIDQVNVAERDAYMQGFDIGVKLMMAQEGTDE